MKSMNAVALQAAAQEQQDHWKTLLLLIVARPIASVSFVMIDEDIR
jgi:nitrate reductase NapE component